MVNERKIDKISSWMGRNMATVVVIFLTIYAFLPVLSPVLFKIDLHSPAKGIQKIYSYLCHQRVDRSLFLFAEDRLFAFYTVEELKEAGALPKEKKSGLPFEIYREEEFGYPYWGNDKVGYKVAYCIRDNALYTGAVIMGWILIILRKKGRYPLKNNIPLWVYGALMFPMIFDGIFQTIVEVTNWSSIPEWYILNIEKRVVTGVLFGIGFAIYIVYNLNDME